MAEDGRVETAAKALSGDRMPIGLARMFGDDAEHVAGVALAAADLVDPVRREAREVAEALQKEARNFEAGTNGYAKFMLLADRLLAVLDSERDDG